MTKFNPFAFLHNLEDAGMEHIQAMTVALIFEELRAAARANGLFDAGHAMRRLETSGFARKQAETLADVLGEVFADARQRIAGP